MMENQPSVSFDDTSIAFSSRSDADLRKMYFLFATMNNNYFVKVGTNVLKAAFGLRLPIKWAVKKTIFEHFCGGESVEDSMTTVDELARSGIGTILDYSVEGAETEESYDATAREIIQTIEKAAVTPMIPFSVFKVTGLANTEMLARKQVAVRKGKELEQEDQFAYDRVYLRVDNICRTAHEYSVRIFFDGEESWVQDVIDKLCYEMMEKYNKEQPIIYNTYQMYRTDMLLQLKTAFRYAVQNEYYLGAKLVRGAYMEKERARAAKKGYPSPIQLDKEATDHDYDEALRFCIDNLQRIALCSGTHNEKSNYFLTILMEKYNIKNNDPFVHFAQLYGMSDNISYNLAHHDYNVVKYVPYGPIKAVMPYLFRRAQENTAVRGQSSREFALINREMDRRKKTAD